jgi:hypothetical protein
VPSSGWLEEGVLMSRRWLVGTMDDGIVYEGQTKENCYGWAEHEQGAPILERSRVETGFYEITLGFPGEDRAHTYYVMRPDAARRHGFAADVRSWVVDRP